MLTEEIKGKSLDEVKQLSKDDILDMLGIPLGPVRLKCGLLALKVLKAGAYGLKGWPRRRRRGDRMSEFFEVAKVSELPPGGKKLVEVDYIPVALFNVAGEFFAIEDVCTHDGGPPR